MPAAAVVLYLASRRTISAARLVLGRCGFRPQLTFDTAVADMEPHPIPGATAGTVTLAWGHEAPANTTDHDIRVDPAVSVP